MIFPTSFGYFDPHILKVAEKFPDRTLLHCGGLYDASKHPSNVGSYFGYIDEAEYVSGIVAGMTTKTGKLGFIAAKPIPQVLRNINAFTLGARSVNPKATTKVIFTGDWALPLKEAEAANSLADQGVDVLTSHVDSPKVIVENAEKRGIFSSGYHASQATLAPELDHHPEQDQRPERRHGRYSAADVPARHQLRVTDGEVHQPDEQETETNRRPVLAGRGRRRHPLTLRQRAHPRSPGSESPSRRAPEG